MAVRLEVLDEFESGPSWGWGEVLLASRPTVYKKIRLTTHENIGYGNIHLGEEQMHTTASWLTLPDGPLWETWDEDRKSTALTGLAHLLRIVAPLFLMCARTDIRVHGVVRDPHFERPTLYLADSYPGGVGLAEAAWNLKDRLMDSAWEALNSCPCKTGCPACVGAQGTTLNAREATRQLLVVLKQARSREKTS
jgi:DEAD/DEAH box helicase domain-containing protein